MVGAEQEEGFNFNARKEKMGKIPKAPEEILGEFADDVKKIYGEELISIILFGSGARGEYKPKASDLNFAIVLEDNSPSELAKFYKQNAKWRKRNVSTPVFFTESYITSSLDTFPVEFLEMQRAYNLVEGKDVLADLQFSKENLRLQCERELKGKLLHLRQSFLESRARIKNLSALIKKSLTAFAPVFRAVLYTVGVQAPEKTEELLAVVSEHFDLDTDLFKHLFQISQGRKKVDKEEINRLFDRYVEEIDKCAHKIDQLPISEEEE